MFMLHVMAVFIVIVPLWSNGGEKATHAQVWTEFENFGGWSSMPLSLFVGQLTAIYNVGGFDIVITVSTLLFFTPCSPLLSHVAHFRICC